MPAEAATNIVNIIQFLYTPQNGSGAYAQHHAHFSVLILLFRLMSAMIFASKSS